MAALFPIPTGAMTAADIKEGANAYEVYGILGGGSVSKEPDTKIVSGLMRLKEAEELEPHHPMSDHWVFQTAETYLISGEGYFRTHFAADTNVDPDGRRHNNNFLFLNRDDALAYGQFVREWWASHPLERQREEEDRERWDSYDNATGWLELEDDE